MHSDTGNNKSIHVHPYRIPLHWRDAVNTEIDNLLRLCIIHVRHSQSPWSSPVIAVKRKTSLEVHLCIDYRALNSVTTPETYQMLRVDEILEALASARSLSKMDLQKGFHQVPLALEVMQNTAFAIVMANMHTPVCPLD